MFIIDTLGSCLKATANQCRVKGSTGGSIVIRALVLTTGWEILSFKPPTKVHSPETKGKPNTSYMC